MKRYVSKMDDAQYAPFTIERKYETEGEPLHQTLRDYGGGGGLQNGRGGHVKFYPYKKEGGKSSSQPEGGGGHNKFWGSFYAGS